MTLKATRHSLDRDLPHDNFSHSWNPVHNRGIAFIQPGSCVWTVTPGCMSTLNCAGAAAAVLCNLCTAGTYSTAPGLAHVPADHTSDTAVLEPT